MAEIRTERMSDHFTKYHLNDHGQLPIPVAPVLHHFTSPDGGNCFHDHPFGLWCTVLHGSYVEESLYFNTTIRAWIQPRTRRKLHDTFYVPADRMHRIIDLPDGECVTVSTYEPGFRPVRLYRLVDGQLRWCWPDGEWAWQPWEDA